MNNNKFNLKEVAVRLASLRELMGVSVAEMAEVTGVTTDEYMAYERGEKDFSFNFLYNCAGKLDCDITELITGNNGKLNQFTITRRGGGMPIIRNSGFNYWHLASNMKDRKAEPFIVSIPYNADLEDKEIEVSVHSGQEMDYVLDGNIKVNINGHEAVLNPGDCVYYNSDMKHGLMAVGGKDAKILAIVMK